jgi:hypothetical protein
MATNTIRYATARHIADLLTEADHLAETQVSVFWPGDKRVTPEMIWIDRIEGDVSVPTMKAGRKDRDDLFRIYWQVRVASRKHDEEASMGRLAEIVAELEDIPADWSTLQDFDGVVDAQVISEQHAATHTPEGVFAFAEVVIEVHARLT